MKCPSCGFTDELPRCPICDDPCIPGETYDVSPQGTCTHTACTKAKLDAELAAANAIN